MLHNALKGMVQHLLYYPQIELENEHYLHFHISIGGKRVGRISMEPRTQENAKEALPLLLRAAEMHNTTPRPLRPVARFLRRREGNDMDAQKYVYVLYNAIGYATPNHGRNLRVIQTLLDFV